MSPHARVPLRAPVVSSSVEVSSTPSLADQFIRDAVAPSTRAAYDVAIRRYTAYWLTRTGDPQPMIDYYHASEWLASMALEKTVRAATIRVYRSALSTAWIERLLPIAPHTSAPLGINPLDDLRIKRAIDGIKRREAKVDAAAPARRRRTDGLTLAMLQALTDLAEKTGEDQHSMTLAAACLGWAAALRPSELLGSRQYPDRALRRDQLTFYSDAMSTTTITPRYTTDSSGTRYPTTGTSITRPDHCVLTINVSKTDQLGLGRTVYVAQPLVVAALWSWMTTALLPLHSDLTSALFQLPGHVPLTTPRLLADLKTDLAATHPDLHLTGKAFRVGGASALMAQGVPAADMASVAWAPGSRMPQVYATTASKARRAIEINRHME
jgi:hypothetical protein